ncbi:MAG: hypothetical protein CMO01_13610 [Thalassobius sp.]|nr:hypothetical protein [Thalassovita sp.]
MKKKKVWKYLHNHASEKEAMDFIDWIKDPANKEEVMEVMGTSWDENDFDSQQSTNKDSKLVYNKIKASIAKQETLRNNLHVHKPFQVWKYITAAIVVFGAWAGFQFYQSELNKVEEPIVAVAFREKVNPSGKRSILTLPDKSRIWLNSGSSLRYPDHFSDTARIVYLSGEAFFDVAKDSLRPFKVISGDIVTVAVGTSFNIRAFPDKEDIEVALTSGKVKIENTHNNVKNEKEAMFLVPGENIVYRKDLLKIEKGHFDTNTVSWKDGIIYLKNAGLEEITEKLALWYGVEFEVKNKAKILYNGSFERKSLRHVMEGISLATGIHYKLDEKKVTIY